MQTAAKTTDDSTKQYQAISSSSLPSLTDIITSSPDGKVKVGSSERIAEKKRKKPYDKKNG